MYTAQMIRDLMSRKPGGIHDPILELALAGAAAQESQVVQTLSSYMGILRNTVCRHDHESKCDEFCGDSGRRARLALDKYVLLTSPVDATIAEPTAPEAECDPDAN